MLYMTRVVLLNYSVPPEFNGFIYFKILHVVDLVFFLFEHFAFKLFRKLSVALSAGNKK